MGSTIHSRQDRHDQQGSDRTDQYLQSREAIEVDDDQEVGSQKSADGSGSSDGFRIVIVIAMTYQHGEYPAQDHGNEIDQQHLSGTEGTLHKGADVQKRRHIAEEMQDLHVGKCTGDDAVVFLPVEDVMIGRAEISGIQSVRPDQQEYGNIHEDEDVCDHTSIIGENPLF